MTIRLVLDSSALGMLCHPAQPKNKSFVRAVLDVLDAAGSVSEILIPAIADYELRRKLLHLIHRGQATQISVDRLDELCSELPYLELSTSVLRVAAQLWAELRSAGLPTAPQAALDADVILAAQTLECAGCVVTTNVRHLARVVPVIRPDDIDDPGKRWIPVRSGFVPPPGFIQANQEGVGLVWISRD